jgi:hypothetical protein
MPNAEIELRLRTPNPEPLTPNTEHRPTVNGERPTVNGEHRLLHLLLLVAAVL